MYQQILVPTDGSPAAESAVEQAVSLAKQYDATIHALYIVDTSAYSTLEAGAEVIINALEEEGEQAVAEIEAAATEAGVDVKTTVSAGTAYRSILEYAGNNGIDLIVMGTHGRRGLDRYLLGSVTERVVRTAKMPVLTVRQPRDED